MPFRETFYPTADGRLQSTNAVYATAQAGSGVALDAASNLCTYGQRLSAGTYYAWAGVFRYDHSVIPDDAIITGVELFMTAGATFAGVQPFSLRFYDANYGAGLDVGDWIDPSTLGGNTLLAEADLTGGWTIGTTKRFTIHPEFLSYINKTGNTDIRMVSSRAVANTPPVGSDEYSTVYTVDAAQLSSRPCLVVTWLLPAEKLAASHNLIDNPKLEVNVTDGWNIQGTVTVAREIAPGVPFPGSAIACAKLSLAASASTYFQSSDIYRPADAGLSYVAGADIYWPGATGFTLRNLIVWADRNKVDLSNVFTDPAHNAGFVRSVIGPAVAPANTFYAYYKIGCPASGAGAWSVGNANQPCVTNVRLDQKTLAVPYADGSLSGWGWLGVADNAESYGDLPHGFRPFRW